MSSDPLDEGLQELTLEDLEKFGLPPPPQWKDLPPAPPPGASSLPEPPIVPPPPPPPGLAGTTAVGTIVVEPHLESSPTASGPGPSPVVEVPAEALRRFEELAAAEEAAAPRTSREDALNYLYAAEPGEAADEDDETVRVASAAAAAAANAAAADAVAAASSLRQQVPGQGGAPPPIFSGSALLSPDEYSSAVSAPGNSKERSAEGSTGERVRSILRGETGVTGNASVDVLLREGLRRFSDQQAAAAAKAAEHAVPLDGVTDVDGGSIIGAVPSDEELPEQTERLNRHMLLAFRNLIDNSELPAAARSYYSTDSSREGGASLTSGSIPDHTSRRLGRGTGGGGGGGGGGVGRVENALPWALQPQQRHVAQPSESPATGGAGSAGGMEALISDSRKRGNRSDREGTVDESDWGSELDF